MKLSERKHFNAFTMPGRQEHSQLVKMITIHPNTSVSEDLQIHKGIRQGSASAGKTWGGRTRRLQSLHFTLPSWDGKCFAGVPAHLCPSLFQPILKMGTRSTQSRVDIEWVWDGRLRGRNDAEARLSIWFLPQEPNYNMTFPSFSLCLSCSVAPDLGGGW